MELDRSGCEVLSQRECMSLLASESLGRLGLHAGALPVILPVAYAVVDDSLIVRTHDRSQVYRAARNSVVAFEVDAPNRGDGDAWSVHVTGRAEEVTDPSEVARLQTLPLRPWTSDGADCFVRIPAQLVSGRRVRSAA